MLDYLKKSLLTGVGLALRSKKEIEELAKEFSENSKMDQEEAKEFLKECQQKYEDAKTDLDHKIETAIEKILTRLDLPSKADIKKLSDRIDQLTKQLSDQK
ncbi:MAG: phasin family protein [Proteobacteria bacterium]|nr:phasin family protein [Pseudomonadota bacterium]MBU1389319.1 phasin family protein [Pseudomonadota bacterium]MBU1544139.1 phasin family protein [Pseudomonadota bacterium]MBU2482724.1 phasin family protein [Pseudomonadota bacterium]